MYRKINTNYPKKKTKFFCINADLKPATLQKIALTLTCPSGKFLKIFQNYISRNTLAYLIYKCNFLVHHETDR